MPNFREMAKHNCWIAKLNETTKLDKQPYCVGCENEVVDWDVYADMRDEYACRVPVCPHCGLVNYVDSKDMNGGLIVLVFFIGLPILLSYGIISSCNLQVHSAGIQELDRHIHLSNLPYQPWQSQ